MMLMLMLVVHRQCGHLTGFTFALTFSFVCLFLSLAPLFTEFLEF